MWFGSSVVRVLTRYARGPGFGCRSGHVLFLPLGHLWLSVGPFSGGEQQRDCLVGSGRVPSRFRADSGTNLIKKGEIVTGRPCGSVAQWSECSHGMREVLGLSPGRAMCVCLPCGICGQCGSTNDGALICYRNIMLTWIIQSFHCIC